MLEKKLKFVKNKENCVPMFSYNNVSEYSNIKFYLIHIRFYNQKLNLYNKVTYLNNIILQSKQFYTFSKFNLDSVEGGTTRGTTALVY
jgi:hypothetical protein